MDLSEISLRLGYPSQNAVVKAISDEIKAEARKLPTPTRSDLLSLQIDRLNYMLSKLWQQVEYGDLATVNTAMKIVDMQCKLLGLHIPDATTQSNTVLVVGGAEADYIRALQSAS